jgi:hypothetical protein
MTTRPTSQKEVSYLRSADCPSCSRPGSPTGVWEVVSVLADNPDPFNPNSKKPWKEWRPELLCYNDAKDRNGRYKTWFPNGEKGPAESVLASAAAIAVSSGWAGKRPRRPGDPPLPWAAISVGEGVG